MTVEDIIHFLGNYPYFILGYFLLLLSIAIVGFVVLKKQTLTRPIKIVYSILLQAVAIPGILSGLLLIYNVFFLRTNALQLNIFIYYLPLIFTIVTLLIIHRTVELESIPGFDRLSGLSFIITGALIVTYLLQRLFFGVFFVGQFSYLIAFFIVIFLLLKLGWNKLSK